MAITPYARNKLRNPSDVIVIYVYLHHYELERYL